MTDAHCHVPCGDSSVRELLIGRDFFGVHPWETLDDGTTGTGGTSETRRASVPDIPVVPDIPSLAALLASLRFQLLANPNAGVGEIGLDRLKSRDISPRMREVFEAQLALALELRRPV
ncbi:MAG: TatD family hydrolase, partial [Kiritimatiellae bacterium]|nr:TatD family hydrolase [Kiritimatiellia bacterium]